MYGPEHVQPPVRSEQEQIDAHPLLAAYFEHRFSKVFTRDEVRERVIPAYMGLIAQIDDQIGRLVAWMDTTGIERYIDRFYLRSWGLLGRSLVGRKRTVPRTLCTCPDDLGGPLA